MQYLLPQHTSNGLRLVQKSVLGVLPVLCSATTTVDRFRDKMSPATLCCCEWKKLSRTDGISWSAVL